jgi:hypothetical protein
MVCVSVVHEPSTPADPFARLLSQRGFTRPGGSTEPAQPARDHWRLTVESGTLHCDGDAVTFETADGRTYAVNGTAIGRHEHPEIDAIWADDPALAGLKKNIGPLIDKGVELC